ncbi:type II toxin-antitoxin system YafQ family toxin [bacterium]|nr:type II toxin-antitoxin system YafQ family toxin [bacterium]
MLKISRTTKFKKDIKRIVKSGRKNTDKLKDLIIMLVNEESLPKKYKNHLLKGNWNNYLECHIEPDWLLIYKIVDSTLLLARTGSHSELFD